MHDLAGSSMLNRVQERWKDGAAIFDPVPLYMNDDDPEDQFLEVDLEFKAPIDHNENINFSLRRSVQRPGNVGHLASATVSTS